MFGLRLKSLRQEKKITQQDLANLLSVSASTVGMYEQQRRDPDTETLKQLAEYFNVSIDYLLGKSDIRNQYPNSKVKMSESNLSGDNLEQLEQEFPEGVKVLRRASKELSPKSKEKMIKLMKLFLEEHDDE